MTKEYILQKGIEYVKSLPLTPNCQKPKESYMYTRKQQTTQKERIASLLERKLKEK